jgi:hypothetical protein
MNALLRQSLLAEYMLSAEPQVRNTLVENDFLYSDRYGIITFDPLVFKPPGDIQNKLLSANRTAMAAVEDNGVFSIWTGEFDKNGMPLKEKKLIFSSLIELQNGDKIGPDKRPYLFGFTNNTLGIYSLPQNNKNVGTLATTPGYTLGSSVKITLMDNGALNLYIGDSLYWSSIKPTTPVPASPPTNQPTTPPANNPLIGPGTSNPLTPTNEKSLFSNPVVLAGLAFAAYKFLNK